MTHYPVFGFEGKKPYLLFEDGGRKYFEDVVKCWEELNAMQRRKEI